MTGAVVGAHSAPYLGAAGIMALIGPLFKPHVLRGVVIPSGRSHTSIEVSFFIPSVISLFMTIK